MWGCFHTKVVDSKVGDVWGKICPPNCRLDCSVYEHPYLTQTVEKVEYTCFVITVAKYDK